MSDLILYDLMTWLSPAYPVGAFSYSSGLEWAVEAGLVTDRESTARWLTDWLERGPGWNDLVVFTHAWRAASAGDRARLARVAELAAAQTSAERRLETTAQGAAFRRIARASAGFDGLDDVDDDGLAYPVAVACLAAAHGAPLREALIAYVHGVASNLVSAAQRLVPLGQTDGQLVLGRLRSSAAKVTARAGALGDGDPFADFANACLMADFAAMAHETQYTRLFRT
jgi:urease accessory protein